MDAASYAQASRTRLYANYFHLAKELDIAIALVKALPRHREDTLQTVAQIDGPTDQTVESGAAQILGFALERL
jgi:hypothetical protein